ncbi:unnamed protein product, partial [Hapterophycus canaliculatus]
MSKKRKRRQLSSCQIYNVEKRIQEDHLQQLALFSEYGRMALRKEHSISTGGPDPADGAAAAAAAAGGGEETAGASDPAIADVGLPSLKSVAGGAAAAAAAGGSSGASGVGFAAKAKANVEARRAAAAGAGEAGAGGAGDGSGAAPSQDRMERPFQRLEFLVRDWQ